MTEKEKFIKMVEELIDVLDKSEYPDEMAYFEKLKSSKSGGPLTEKGAKILLFMQSNVDTYNNIFTSDVIGNGIELTPRSVSSSMKKLVDDKYVEKTKGNKVTYSLSEKGKNFSI